MAELRSLQRAKKVLAKRSELRFEDEKYVNFLKGLPAMIMQNGLGQTAAMLRVKGNKDQAFAKIYQLLCGFLLPPNTHLMQAVVEEADIAKYLRLQHEALEYAAWMKQFALAFQVSSSDSQKNENREIENGRR
jgi:CRISPR/Cas system CMR-associated protein Cmr5 small subunit